MMPTAQKPLIIGDVNQNSNFCLNESNNSSPTNLQTNTNQSNGNLKINQSGTSLQNKNSNSQSSTSSSIKSTDHQNGSLNDKNSSVDSQINQRILNDLTNNNIVDCLSKNSKSKDLNDQTNQTTNRDSQISEVSSNQNSINSNNNLSSNLSNNNSVTSDQKSKNKKYLNDKSIDSSSSNGSLVSDLPTNSLINQSVSKEEQQPICSEIAPIWKYSKTHQKRFKRRFPTIEQDEQLIDWFSCALIADILLQGYLYISQNYFAFYSNIFGYKTHVLIKVSDVHSITKEKTAKIFPNAVGIHAKQNKFVFGSLLSRETTFKLLNVVRNYYLNLNKEKTTTDFSEDDLLDNSLKLNSTLKNEGHDSSNGEMISLKEFKDKNKKLLHSEDNSIDNHQLDTHHLEHVKFETLRRHQRSSSLRSSIKDSENDFNKKLNQSKLLKSNKFVDLNTIILKLSSIKSILRTDLKGSRSSFLIISIAFLLFLLLISISVLLVRINSAHEKLISLSKYSHSILFPEIDLFNEMFKMIEVMKSNLNEISRLKNKLN